MYGGKREGAGRPLKKNKAIRRLISFEPDIWKIVEQLPSGERSKFLNRLVREWQSREN